MKIISMTLRLFVTLMMLTALGQITLRGRKLENRYHDYVNSSDFQNAFWTFTRPATWTFEKVSTLLKNEEQPAVR